MTKTYYFDIDEKCTIWERSRYCVNAKNYEEALKIINPIFTGEKDGDDYHIVTETIHDTVEYMTVEDNGGQPTKELMYENETILTNEKMD
jgi:hypothetical protein